MIPRLSVVVALACAPSALGQFVVDGTRDAAYPAAIAVQTQTTMFGDSTDALCEESAGGSELCNLHATIDGGVLYIFIGGNLENNFNKLELFIDAHEGGQNTLRGDNPDVDFNGLNRMGTDAIDPGLTFDECFTADFYVTCTNGGSPVALYANIAQMNTEGGGNGAYIGSGAPCTAPITSKYGVIVALNNSNAAGVGGDGGTVDGAAAVDTGIEVAIPLVLLGYDASVQQNIKFVACVNGGGHDYLSNQFLGSVAAGSGNLAEPRLINLANMDGDQFATLVMDPQEPNCPAVPPACPGDFDGDHSITGADMTALLSAWATADGDLNGDGTTDGTDLTILLSGWGECPQ